MLKANKKASEYKLPSDAQIASALLMIKPTDFKPLFDEVAEDFDQNPNLEQVQEQAVREYERCLRLLRTQGVLVVNFDKNNYPSLADVDLPTAIFPDNLMTWADGTVIRLNNNSFYQIHVFPMESEIREKEKILIPYLLNLVHDAGFLIAQVNEIQRGSEQGSLEAKGSLILDRKLKRVYASVSRRTSESLVLQWAKQNDYEPIVFKSFDQEGKEIQHTDFMLNIGEKFAIVCDEAIEEKSRKRVIEKLSENREVILVTMNQALNGFVCNSAEVRAECSIDKHHVLIMSKKGVESLTDKQVLKLKKYATIIPFDIPTIEKYGGGSARCLIAELFNPYKPFY